MVKSEYSDLNNCHIGMTKDTLLIINKVKGKEKWRLVDGEFRIIS